MTPPVLNKDTVLCISISARPGSFGMTVHNAAYRAVGLDFIYKAFRVEDLAGALAGVRALGIRGCSVSMPFKERAIAFVDSVDAVAASIGAINTIINESGRLVGFNTDVFGVRAALEPLPISRDGQVLVLGAGGMARAIVYALKSLGFTRIALTNRSAARLDGWPSALQCPIVPWEERNEVPAQLLVNATSVGMAPLPQEMPVVEALLSRVGMVVDAVASPAETRLVRTARRFEKPVVTGVEISLFQAAEQFRLYTKHEPPLGVMRAAAESLARIGV